MNDSYNEAAYFLSVLSSSPPHPLLRPSLHLPAQATPQFNSKQDNIHPNSNQQKHHLDWTDVDIVHVTSVQSSLTDHKTQQSNHHCLHTCDNNTKCTNTSFLNRNSWLNHMFKQHLHTNCNSSSNCIMFNKPRRWFSGIGPFSDGAFPSSCPHTCSSECTGKRNNLIFGDIDEAFQHCRNEDHDDCLPSCIMYKTIKSYNDEEPNKNKRKICEEIVLDDDNNDHANKKIKENKQEEQKSQSDFHPEIPVFRRLNKDVFDTPQIVDGYLDSLYVHISGTISNDAILNSIWHLFREYNGQQMTSYWEEDMLKHTQLMCGVKVLNDSLLIVNPLYEKKITQMQQHSTSPTSHEQLSIVEAKQDEPVQLTLSVQPSSPPPSKNPQQMQDDNAECSIISQSSPPPPPPILPKLPLMQPPPKKDKSIDSLMLRVIECVQCKLPGDLATCSILHFLRASISIVLSDNNKFKTERDNLHQEIEQLKTDNIALHEKIELLECSKQQHVQNNSTHSDTLDEQVVIYPDLSNITTPTSAQSASSSSTEPLLPHLQMWEFVSGVGTNSTSTSTTTSATSEESPVIHLPVSKMQITSSNNNHISTTTCRPVISRHCVRSLFHQIHSLSHEQRIKFGIDKCESFGELCFNLDVFGSSIGISDYKWQDDFQSSRVRKGSIRQQLKRHGYGWWLDPLDRKKVKLLNIHQLINPTH
jgi:hypothetical protein